MSRIEEFEKARPLLLSIAHRMLSSARQAEAAVHQAWLHYEASPEQPVSGRAFLTTALTDICLDALRRAHARQERAARTAQLPPRREGEVPHAGAAALALLQQLGPTERAVFILREVLHCTPAQTAAIVGCPEAACHRTAATAARTADGPAVPSWPRRIIGADHIARVFAAIVPALDHVGVTLAPQQVGGHPGAVFRDRHGTVLSTLAFDVRDGRIQTIHWATGPHLSTDTPAQT
ncbi:sigma factor-like helix-turn-helix DNA-binding protein [Streptomyces longwoodensis]|uniref:sigma factor-like helix-turn-helix DNA-binding protein n=1 Tax=Streptomyces longwoodensis TaxID=68231 RepID=UPI0036FF89D1